MVSRFGIGRLYSTSRKHAARSSSPYASATLRVTEMFAAQFSSTNSPTSSYR